MDTQCSKCEDLLSSGQWGAVVREDGEDRILCERCLARSKDARVVFRSAALGLVRFIQRQRIPVGR